MRIPRLLTLLVALAVMVAVILGGMQLVRPARPLVEEAAFDRETITPNADGDNDLTTFTYTLTRNALVTLVLIDADGYEYFFRDSEPRVPDTYRVNFGGVVRGYILPDEDIEGEVETRLLANGDYTWRLTAVAEDGEVAQESGRLTIADADSTLPELVGLDISRAVFTPNQDGIDDRLTVNVYVTKDATLTMYLENEDVKAYVTEVMENVPQGTAGLHTFDYDGGIDIGRDPPPDGDYTLVLLAEDAEGQRVRRTGQVAIRDGGYPLGAIYPQLTGTTVFYDTMPYDERYFTDADHPGDLIPVPEGVESTISDTEVVRQGDLMVFRLTVVNDGPVALRTSGPEPGTVYEQWQRSGSIGWFDQSGAWRIGLECDTAKSSYPWRWALAPRDQLTEVQDGGNTYYYLEPGQQAVVWGAVRLTEILPQRNPQPCWIGLIHEDVAVVEADVDRRWVEIVPGPGDVAPPGEELESTPNSPSGS